MFFIIQNTKSVEEVLPEIPDKYRQQFADLVERHHIPLQEDIIGWYENGNYCTVLFGSGLRFKFNDEVYFKPAFAECIDLMITEKCDGGCEFCYAECTPSGRHGQILNEKFLNSLHPLTEVAINLNDMTHPDLDKFLIEMKKRNIVVSGTINQKHLAKCADRLSYLQAVGLINGIGVSYDGSREIDELIHLTGKLRSVVIHVIAGVVDLYQLEELAHHNMNILILGYKKKGRGVEYFQHDREAIESRLRDFIVFIQETLSPGTGYKNICLDTLAVKQFDRLNPDGKKLQDLIPNWGYFYQGEDGEYTFFVDLVRNRYAMSSTETNFTPIPDSFNIDEMFNTIKS